MRKGLITFLKVTVSALLLYLVFSRITLADLFSHLLGIRKVYLLLACIILFIQYILSSLKWWFILKSDLIDVPFKFLLKNYFIGNFISLFLPSSFGGDIYRVYALKEYSQNLFQNTSSVLFDRISGLFALTSICLVSYTLFFPRKAYVFYLVYFCSLGAFFFLFSSRVRGVLANFRVLRSFVSLFESFTRYRDNKGNLAVILLISFLFQNNIVIIVKLYCFALAVSVDLQYLYVVIPLVYLSETLPVSINGLGVREGAFVFFFLQAGQTRESALAVALLVISVRYLFSISTGGVFTLSMLLRSHNSRRAEGVSIN